MTPTRAQAASHLRAGHAEFTPSRTHVRDTDAIRRDLALARDQAWRASVARWLELTVSPVTVKVREPNDRLLGLLLADREWTAEEREYVDACERNGR